MRTVNMATCIIIGLMIMIPAFVAGFVCRFIWIMVQSGFSEGCESADAWEKWASDS